jgi:Protein of unknown function (DUF4231)
MTQSQSVAPVNPANGDRMAKWKAREDELLESLNHSMKYYSSCAWWARILHRLLGLLILICVVISPVAVVSTGGQPDQGLSALGIPAIWITRIAVATTILLAFAEGLRRTFQFDDRWATCIRTREELRGLKGAYLDDQLQYQVGEPAWVTNLSNFRKREQETRAQEEMGFFERVRAERKSDERSKDRPPGVQQRESQT